MNWQRDGQPQRTRLGYTYSEIKDFPDPAVIGNEAPLISRYTPNSACSTHVPIGELDLSFRVDYRRTGRTWWEPYNTTSRDPVDLVDARVGLGGEHWAASLSARTSRRGIQPRILAGRLRVQGAAAALRHRVRVQLLTGDGIMATKAKLPNRLHHNAYVSKDLEATRKFYEDVIGLPLLATWCEKDMLFGAERTYCHCFFGLGDGGALAFFQFADPKDAEQFGPKMPFTPFHHIALHVDADDAGRHREAAEGRRATRSRRSFVLEHGYCRSVYADDPERHDRRVHARSPGRREDQRGPAHGCARRTEALARGRPPLEQHVSMRARSSTSGSSRPTSAACRARRP